MARGLVVVLAASLVGAGLWFTVGPGAAPPTGGCETVATVTASSGAAPTTEASVSWDRAALPPGFEVAGEQILLDVVAFRGGFVVVGRSSSGRTSHAFTLTSPDGVSWHGSAERDAERFAGTELRSLTVAMNRIFAVGSASTDDRGGSRLTVWSSEDGREWSEARGPFDEHAPHSLAATEDGLLLIGAENSAAQPRAWRSSDGITWEIVDLELPIAAGQARLDSLAPFGAGWIAGGSVSNGVGAAAAPVVWRSDDGRSWSCHVLDGAGLYSASVHALHASGNGSWLAIGGGGGWCPPMASCAGEPLVWNSTDGLTWSAALRTGEPMSHGGALYAGTEDGFVAVAGGTTWLSGNGDGWARVATGDDGLDVGGEAADADDERVVVVGTSYDGPDADPVIVVGELSP